MTARAIMTDTDMGIPDLIRRLTDDSKRLVTDEVQLAKLETKETMQQAGKGVLWMALAFGAAVVMLVALTVFLTTFIGRLANGHMWVGAIVTGLLELGAGAWCVKRGISAYTEPSYSLEATRHALADTANWATTSRER